MSIKNFYRKYVPERLRTFVYPIVHLDSHEKHATKEEMRQLRYHNFTIISNNCWGGWVYRYFKQPYNSPTVGLFFLSKDYIKFVSDLRRYMEAELVFIKPEEANQKDEAAQYIEKWGQYPIGRLIDVDVHFLHSKNEKDAYDCWNRRKRRVNYSRIIIKMSMQNLWDDKYGDEFNNLDFPNKLLFTNKEVDYNNVTKVLFTGDIGQPETRNEGEEYRKYMNILEYINQTKDTSEYFNLS